MMPWLRQLALSASGWFASHQALTFILLGVSIVVSLGGMLLLPWVVVKIPPDYFAHKRAPRLPFADRHPVTRIVLVVAKNLLGLLLVLGGLAMSLPMVPGPGIISAVLGLMLLDLPGKRSIERWIVRQPFVLRTMNSLRIKAGQPPLEAPEPN